MDYNCNGCGTAKCGDLGIESSIKMSNSNDCYQSLTEEFFMI